MSQSDPSAATHAYSWVLNAIANGRLVPGERYSIYWLADELGYSRTPTREAILRLAQLGVIDIERNRGFAVRQLDVEEVRANYEARMLLEVASAKAAAARTSPELVDSLHRYLVSLDKFVAEANTPAYLEWDRALHAEIVHAGGNKRVEQLAGTLRDASIQTWDVYTPGNPQRRRETQQQHYKIVNAIADGDVEAAGKAMQFHLESTAVLLMRRVASRTGDPLPEHFFGCLRPYPEIAPAPI